MSHEPDSAGRPSDGDARGSRTRSGGALVREAQVASGDRR